MTRLLTDLRSATRSLRRSPAYAATVIAILAIALGATALVWTAFDAVVLRPLPFSKPGELTVVYDANRGRPMPLSPPNFLDLRREAKSYESMAAFAENSLALSGREGAAEQLSGALVSSDFFRTLGVTAAHGRLLGSVDEGTDPISVVLGHGLWTRRYGADPEVVGRTVKVDGRTCVVVGVLAPGLEWPLGAELWLPLTLDEASIAGQRGAHYLRGLGRLRPGISPETAQAELEALAARLAKEFPRTNEGVSAYTRPLAEHFVRRARPTMLLMVGAVLLALAAACANLASVALARATSRAREVAVRASLGAPRGRLVREQFLESIVLALGGALLGCLLAAASVRSLPSWAGDLPRLQEARLDLGAALLAASLAGLCGLAIGLVPALHALRRDPAEALHAAGRGVAGHRAAGRTRRALVVTTTALAFVLIAGAALTLRSWNRVSSVDPGLDPAGKLTFGLGIPDGKYATAEATSSFVARLLERLEQLPGVTRAVAQFGQPYGDFRYAYTVSKIDGAELPDAGDDLTAAVRVVTPGYFETLGIPLVSGRTFTAADRHGAPPVVIASEAAVARLLADRPAVGRTLELGGSFWDERGNLGGEVVGVVGDVREHALDEAPEPVVYFVFDQAPSPGVTVTLATEPERTGALIEPARRVVADLDPDVPMHRVRTLEALIAESMAQRALVARLLTGFGAATTLLAAIGLFGVLAAAVADRRRELAVRGSLGATPGELVAIVVRQAALLDGLGLALGLGLAVPMARFLAGQLYEIEPGDPRTLAAAALALLVVSALSTWIPARRAASVDPASVLREE